MAGVLAPLPSFSFLGVLSCFRGVAPPSPFLSGFIGVPFSSLLLGVFCSFCFFGVEFSLGSGIKVYEHFSLDRLLIGRVGEDTFEMYLRYH